jgi:hypothetical protein
MIVDVGVVGDVDVDVDIDLNGDGDLDEFGCQPCLDHPFETADHVAVAVAVKVHVHV